MALSPGTRLGAFEIVDLLGVGGMGEVYRARDSKLKRDVALKVLPPDVAADPERLARFQREAEVLASLNHPHIAHIYGVEEVAGTTSGQSVSRALVMELVDGPTLEERIAKGPVPFDEARPIALQLADALSAAHDRGVIHRDLKPANIKLAGGGGEVATVKVLDFGLAKALDPANVGHFSGADRVAHAPTITSPAMTRVGMFLGTAAYMAPEQARGAVVDKRADIWAFGVVLFEMLTGQRPFAGETVTDTLANVLKTEPDWNRLPADTPASVRRLLRRCLHKDRTHRLQDIGDARLELEEADAPPGQIAPPLPVPSPRSRLLRAAAIFAAGIATALLATTTWQTLQPPAADMGTPLEFLITPLDGVSLDDPAVFAVSPSGEHLLLRGYEGGVPFLYIRPLRGGPLRRLNSTKGVGGVLSFWSPDSAWIAFGRSNSIYRVAVDDSQLQTLQGQGRVFGLAGSGSWSPEGGLLVSSASELVRVSASGGSPVVVIGKTVQHSPAVLHPWALPDGKRFLLSDSTTRSMLLASADGSPPRRLESGLEPAYAAPGWVLAVRGTRLVAWRFDLDRGAIQGEPLLIRENVTPRGGMPGRVFSVSQTGVLAIRNEARAISTRVAWFDRSGAESGSLKLNLHCRNPEIAPDGGRVALECYEESTNNRDIWIYDLTRNAASRLTNDPADDADPLWSPDGRTIVFASNRAGAVDVYRKNASGASQEELVLDTPGSTPTMAWSPNGDRIAVMQAGAADLATFALNGDRRLEPVVSGPFQEFELQFSPDGRFFSYCSDESGRSEIYVQPWPPTGDRWPVSADGATDARWSADGKELFYLSPSRVLMSVAIDSTKGFKPGTPVAVFETKIAGRLGSGQRFPYAVSRDGKRFLMYVSDVQAPPTISVIVNWPALLKKP